MKPMTSSLLASLLLLLTTGCESKKNLNETTGRELLQQRISTASFSNIANGNLVVDAGAVQSRWVGRETADDLTQLPGLDLQASKFLQSGFMTVTANSRTYSLAQNWTGRMKNPPLFEWTVEIHLGVSNTGDINGSWIRQEPFQPVCSGNVQGKLEPNGRVTINFVNCTVFPPQVVANLTNGGTALTHIDYFDTRPTFGDLYPINFRFSIDGKDSKTVKIPIFKYEWSPQIQEFAQGPYGAYRVGQIKVEEISELTLAGTETQAKARFRWSLAPNELGRALQGSPLLDGGRYAMRSGDVQYTKKPDGTWVVSQFSL